MPGPPELHDASLGYLLAVWQEIAAERLGMVENTACVEPPEARDEIRRTIESDRLDLAAELHRRRHLLDGINLAGVGDDGAMLMLRPM
jgi:hypothetical protein